MLNLLGANMRQSLRQPIKELELAAKLLDAAVDAFILKNYQLADSLLVAANFPEINEYAKSIVGKLSFDIHRQTKLPKRIPISMRDPTRMPSQIEQNAIFLRDGWRCRFCGIKVISKKARALLASSFKIETHWTSIASQRNSALYALASSLDHIDPHGRGGKNEQSNFVTACYCCQFGRGDFTLAEVEVLNPLNRMPIIDDWDGLTRVLQLSPNTVSQVR
ncbi:HNH endonuclease [Acinetobacter dispersus]|uniref:HNH endonuclease n=1 Tax=Acinetobacter dispersus TaxID=70348 RepID=UPI001F4B5F1D|nr:HNH endonuclease [Acinetobacter dispersus]MCH7395724.1 HNH endonuclease [Acinetobacter dispersus]